MFDPRRRHFLAMAGAGIALSAGPIGADTQPRPEGGIGGTGIVGILTDFGSIVLNGMRVETPSGLRPTNAFGQVTLNSLGIGQSLTVEARAINGRLMARRIHIAHPVIGPVHDIDGNRARVAGVPVVLEPGVVGGWEPGMVAAISGVWRGQTVVASRIARARTSLVVIAGEVVARTRQTIVIGGRTIDTGRFMAPYPGRFVTVIGEDRGPDIRARELTVGRFTGAAGRLRRLSVDGFLEPQAEAPFYAVSGLGHSFAPDLRLESFASERTLFDGAYNGLFEARTGIALPQSLALRRQINRDLLSGVGPERVAIR
ncbi:MAG: hypothetical protein JKP98_13510 [Rhodobacteraceae bacterium]|mgnify:CR=1 FL=1|jgi:hypothetical protein|nr:hypothetical protein [Paracoccaceae bacterium]MBL4557756.1 hypothetical protein [Paracoccaceae bacterium]HBG97176.1 hypothetical protein [Paracoccaceae bacterium]